MPLGWWPYYPAKESTMARRKTRWPNNCPSCEMGLWGEAVGAAGPAKVVFTSGDNNMKQYGNASRSCGCGEAMLGTGASCFRAYADCKYKHSFKRTDNIWMSYSRLHYLPEKYGVRTVADIIKRLQMAWPHNPSEVEDRPVSVFAANCGGGSGRALISKVLSDRGLADGWGKCWNTRDIKRFEPPKERWHWEDSEGNRDTTKTDITARYKFTVSMENTFDEDYFTEKRYEALVSGSIPIIFRKPAPGSETFLPHPNAAVYADDFATREALADYIGMLDKNTTLYQAKHHSWKSDGVSREFVKILFHSSNYLPCRVCEAEGGMVA